MKLNAVFVLAFALLCQSVGSVSCQSPGDYQVRPRGYSDPERIEVKAAKGKGPTEITVGYPEEVQHFAGSMRRMFEKQHHQGSFKQSGLTWTLIDETAKKTWIIKAKHSTPRKKPDIKGLEAAAGLFPKSTGLLAEISRIGEEQKNWPVALEYYRKAFDPGPPNIAVENLVSGSSATTNQGQVAANCAYFELMMGHYTTAVKLLSKAIELDPDYVVNYKNRAEAYRKLHKLDLAIQDEKKMKELMAANKVQVIRTPKPESNGSIPMIFVAIGEYDEALSRADAMLHKAPKSGIAHLARARTLVRLGKYNEALPDYQALLQLTKDAPSVKREMLVAQRLTKQGPPPYGELSLLQDAPTDRLRQYVVLRNGKKVPTTIAKIAADHKGDYRVYSAVCAALKRRNMPKPLDLELDKLLAIDADDSNAVGNKIETTEALLQWPTAEKWCNRYLELLANNDVQRFRLDFLEYVYTVRALARRAQKNCPAAIEDETIVLRLAPESAGAFSDRGDCYMQCAKYDLALADYTKSVEYSDTKDSALFLRRAAAYEKLNKSDLARQDRDTAAKIERSANAPAEKTAPD
jgi:tetratricopeptide (TPR) repeat protein